MTKLWVSKRYRKIAFDFFDVYLPLFGRNLRFYEHFATRELFTLQLFKALSFTTAVPLTLTV